MVPNWSKQLATWRQHKKDEYARVMMQDPETVNAIKAMRFPGCFLILGARRTGKTAMAHYIAHELHEKKGIPAVVHLPTVPHDVRKKIQKLLPPWMKVTLSRDEWPKGCLVIYDEAAQTAHARRTQSGDAVDLDNLISISGQRMQMILFLAHFSRKIDPNIATEVDGILWKEPSYAHQMFERDELSDFTMKAFDFFRSIKDVLSKKKATLMLDLHSFNFVKFNNGLAPWWNQELSCLFEDIQNVKKEGAAKH